MTTEHPPVRTPSAIDALADRFVQKSARLDPFTATSLGIPGFDHLVPDLSPTGIAARTDLVRRTLDELTALEPVDAVDEVTLAAMRERLGLDLELEAAGEHHRMLNVIASPLQEMRDVFDVAPQDTLEHWEDIASRLNALP